MGYRTKYTLEHTGHTVTVTCPHCGGSGKINESVHDKIQNFPFCEDGGYTIGSMLKNRVKWYEHEEDMKRFSQLYPDVVFTLRGEGEDSGDIWVKYFKNGKMQESKAIIKLDAFDESKLK